jgi:hypothetical protein
MATEKMDLPTGAGEPQQPESLASPVAPSPPASPSKIEFSPLVAVVDFHHARGPEVEAWFGAEDGSDPAVEYRWSLLPFMALSDGAHA